jgi:outer membrane protein, multidrug efflux system
VKALATAVLLRYRTALANCFEVIEAEQQLCPAEDALAPSQGAQLVAIVDLYRASYQALGGGLNSADGAWTATR